MIKCHFPVEKKKDIVDIVNTIAKDFKNSAFKSGFPEFPIFSAMKEEILIKKSKNLSYGLGASTIYPSVLPASFNTMLSETEYLPEYASAFSLEVLFIPTITPDNMLF